MTDGETIEIKRQIAAPVRRVFEAWTTAAEMMHFASPEDAVVVEAESELRPGGVWRVLMRGDDGSMHEAVGVYLEVDPPGRVVHTHAWAQPDGSRSPETRVTVTFDESPGGTTAVKIRQTRLPSADSAAGHDSGWTSLLNRFGGYLASGRPAAT